MLISNKSKTQAIIEYFILLCVVLIVVLALQGNFFQQIKTNAEDYFKDAATSIINADISQR